MLKVFKNDMNNTHGFTLIEVIISITLLALMMTYMVSIMDNSIRTKEGVLAEDKDFMQLETAMARFDLDYSQIYSPLFFSSEKNKKLEKEANGPTDDDNKNVFEPSEKFPLVTSDGTPVPLIENPNKYSFSFFTGSNRRKVQDAKQSHYAWVKYEMRPTADIKDEENRREGGTNELVRYMSPNDPYSKDHDWDGLKPYILLRNIKTLQFLFWDSKKKKYVDRAREIAEGKEIIRGVKIIITWVDINGNELEVERTFRALWPFFDAIQDEKDKKKKPEEVKS